MALTRVDLPKKEKKSHSNKVGEHHKSWLEEGRHSKSTMGTYQT